MLETVKDGEQKEPVPNKNIFYTERHDKGERRLRVTCVKHTAWIIQVKKLIWSPTSGDSQGSEEIKEVTMHCIPYPLRS